MNTQSAMSDQSKYHPKPNRLIRRPSPLWPKSLKEAEQLAQLVFDAKLAPKGFGSPKACLVGILYGMELGLSPMAALQKIALIDGRPTLWGDAALALVQSSGLLGSFSETIEQHIDPSTNHLRWVATCSLTRANFKDPIIRTFTSDDARRAGLWQKPGPWSQYPKRMLTIRARAFALRDAFPDILAGLYIQEELDIGNTIVEEIGDTQANSTGDAIETQEFEAPSFSNQAKEPERNQIDIATFRRAPPPPAPPPTTIPTDNPQTEPLSEKETDPFDPPFITQQNNPTQLIADFDNALCCAFDTETLEEIREEFQPKIDTLGSDFIAEAGRIFLRHEQRVQLLTEPVSDEAYKNGAENNIDHRVSSLQTGRLSQRARRSKGMPSLSLLALHARQRLSAIQHQHEEDRSLDNDQSEGQALDGVNDLTSPKTGMLKSQHPHSPSATPIQELDTVQPSDD